MNRFTPIAMQCDLTRFDLTQFNVIWCDAKEYDFMQFSMVALPPSGNLWLAQRLGREPWRELASDSSGDEKVCLRNSLERKNQSTIQLLVTSENNKDTGPLQIIIYKSRIVNFYAWALMQISDSYHPYREQTSNCLHVAEVLSWLSVRHLLGVLSVTPFRLEKQTES